MKTSLMKQESEARSRVKAASRNAEVYCEKFLKITNKEAQTVPLKFNIVQKRVYEEIQKLKKAGKPIRLVVLKARQMGISTQTEGLIFHDTSTKRNRESLIMAHEPKSTQNIFEMNKFFYDNLDPLLRPMKRYDSTTRFTFDNPDEKQRGEKPGLKSQITIATAARSAVGRGLTIHNFHGSEVAFWKNGKDIMLAVSQAIPDHADTMVVLESTANGVGGYFYDIYWAAKRGENDYVAIFIPWFEFPEYSRKLDPGFKLTPNEESLKKLYNLTDEQINWRRWCIANKCDGDENTFKQEYPSSDKEAFIVSGSPKFNQANLQLYDEYRKPPVFVGEIISEDDADSVKEPELQKDLRGRLKIYQYPDPRHSYVIGGDTSKGTEHSDFACLQVIDKHTGDQVATWHGKADPTLLAYIAARLGYYYKGGHVGALLGIEVNKDGITTNKVLHKDIKYPRIFRRKAIDDKTEKTQVVKLGFHTNERSRPLIINKLARWINEGEFEFNDETTITECMTFAINDAGKPEAQEGCYDDAVISLAIAVYLYEYIPPAPKEKTEIQKHMDTIKKRNQGGTNW